MALARIRTLQSDDFASNQLDDYILASLITHDMWRTQLGSNDSVKTQSLPNDKGEA